MKPYLFPTELSGPYTLEVAIKRGQLLEKTFSVSQANIDSKMFHSWKLDGLLSTIEKGKMAKMSFVELMWLYTLDTMRKFGCSRKLMKDLHDYFFTRAYKDKLTIKTYQGNLNYLNTLSLSSVLTYDQIEEKKYYEEFLNNETLLLKIEKDITYFYQLVVSCFANNHEVGIIILEDGSFSTYESRLSLLSADIDLSQPHLLIPITHLIKSFIINEEKEKFLEPSGIINEEEASIIKHIRNRNVQKLTIHFKNDNHKISKIELEENGILDDAKVKKAKELLGLKNYQSIYLTTRDNKTLSFKKTTNIIK
jgi:hypothetical protein